MRSYPLNYVSSLFIIIALRFFGNASSCESTEFCNCSRTQDKFQYSCSVNTDRNATVIDINASTSGVVIFFDCHNIQNIETKYLPKKNFVSVQWIEMENCPVPLDGFHSIIERFANPLEIKHLSFQKQSTNEILKNETFQNLKNLEYLTLSRNNMTIWTAEILQQLPKLIDLRIDNNKLKLYNQMFANGSEIIFLSITHNNLTKIPLETFDDLRKLQGLDISFNNLINIDPLTFEPLVSLSYLNLESNELLPLGLNVLHYSSLLSRINLSNNFLKNISREMFNRCRPEWITVNNNKNLILSNATFSKFNFLLIVELEMNNLTWLPENLFHESVNLGGIYLSSNNLQSLPRKLFQGLEKLSEIYLSNNKLRTLHPELFVTQKTLRYLGLDRNHLSDFKDDILCHTIKLIKVNLSSNYIQQMKTTIPTRIDNVDKSWFSGIEIFSSNFSLTSISRLLKKLEFVDLSHNQLTEFPEASVLASAAGTLDLSFNTITELDINKIQLRTKVQKVNLEYNNISHIHLEGFQKRRHNNTFHIFIDVSNNPLSCDCHVLDLIQYIRNYNVTGITTDVHLKTDELLCQSPKAHRNKTLMMLNPEELVCQMEETCSENNECLCSYRTVDKIFIVNCSERNLTHIPKLLLPKEYERHLEIQKIYVNLEGNNLTNFKQTEGYSRISELSLRRNSIENISWIPSTLKVLDMRDNKLKKLNGEFLTLLNSTELKSMKLGQNPWICDCEALTLLHMLKQKISHVADIRKITCNGTGLPLLSLNDADLCKPKTNYILTLVFLSLLIFIATALISLTCYINKEVILAWLYAHGICLFLIKEERLDRTKIYDAFISFSHHEDSFVSDILVPALEYGTPPYKICVHNRDWIPGEFITNQITNSIKRCKRILIVLSKSYLKSPWAKMEVRMAKSSELKEHRSRIIIIIYEDVDIEGIEDEEFKAYVKTNTYIKWGDRWFWEKLRYAMPRTRNK